MSDPRDPYRELHSEEKPKKLDVIAAAREAYAGAWSHLSEMVRLIWLPGALYLALNMIGAMLPGEGNFILGALIEMASLMLWVIISVAWYRFILIGEAPQGAFQLNFTRREARYLLVSILLVLLAAPSLLFAGPPEFPPAAAVAKALAEMGSAGSLVAFFGLLISFVCIYFLIRLLLLLPAASIDEPFDIRMVLERTRGNFWRILALCILSSLPLLMAYILIVSIFVALNLPLVIALFFSSLLSIFFAIVNVAILAIAYRELIGPPGTMAAESDRQNTA
ncbi:MAG: hypothetical protein WA138_13160 [Parvibaculum sp.]